MGKSWMGKFEEILTKMTVFKKSIFYIYHIHSYSIYFRTTITIKTECKSAKGVSKMESFSNHTPIQNIPCHTSGAVLRGIGRGDHSQHAARSFALSFPEIDPKN